MATKGRGLREQVDNSAGSAELPSFHTQTRLDTLDVACIGDQSPKQEQL